MFSLGDAIMVGHLQGPQYVQLAPGAAVTVAPYVGVPAAEIDELLIDLIRWPEEVRPAPRRALDGRLLLGDPLLIGAGDSGLVFHGLDRRGEGRSVLVPWSQVRALDVLSMVAG